MNLFESVSDFLHEKLERSFYSQREAELSRGMNPTTMTAERNIEKNYVSYDPFASFANNDLMSGMAANATYAEKVKKWRDNSILPEVDEAISEIVNEAVVFDEEEDVIKLNLDGLEVSDGIKKKMHESFDKIMFMLDFNERGDDLFRQWYVDAKLPLEVVYDNKSIKSGIKQLIQLPPHNITRVKNEKTGEFRWVVGNDKVTYNPVKDLDDPTKTFFDEQITCIDSGIYSPDRKHPISYLNKSLKSINQLYLIEDSMVIYRITRAPEKRAFYIDTGNLPKSKAEEYVKSMILKFRQKKIYNLDSGTVENKAKTISILEDFWFPTSANGRGTKVENLPGTGADLSNVADLDYFVNKVYRSLNVPTSRRSQDSRMQIGTNLDVEKDELKFFKFVLRLRRRFNNLFVDLLKKDLIARGVFTIKDWNQVQEKIKFVYANNNAYSEIRELQILNMRIDAANQAMPLVEAKMISKTRLRRQVLKQTEEEIEEIDVEIANETPVDGGSDGEDDYSSRFGAKQKQQTEPEEPTEPEQPEQPSAEESRQEYLKSSIDYEKLSEMIASKMVPQPIPDDVVVIKKSVLESLRDGDVIASGDSKIAFKNGKFVLVGP